MACVRERHGRGPRAAATRTGRAAPPAGGGGGINEGLGSRSLRCCVCLKGKQGEQDVHLRKAMRPPPRDVTVVNGSGDRPRRSKLRAVAASIQRAVSHRVFGASRPGAIQVQQAARPRGCYCVPKGEILKKKGFRDSFP